MTIAADERMADDYEHQQLPVAHHVRVDGGRQVTAGAVAAEEHGCVAHVLAVTGPDNWERICMWWWGQCEMSKNWINNDGN